MHDTSMRILWMVLIASACGKSNTGGAGGGAGGGEGPAFELAKAEIVSKTVKDIYGERTERSLHVEVTTKESKAAFALVTPDDVTVSKSCSPPYTFDVPLDKLAPKDGKVSGKLWSAASCSFPERGRDGKLDMSGITVKPLEIVVPIALEWSGDAWSVAGRDCSVTFKDNTFGFQRGDASACGTWEALGAKLAAGPITCEGRAMGGYELGGPADAKITTSGTTAAAKLPPGVFDTCASQLFANIGGKGVTFPGEPATSGTKTLIYFPDSTMTKPTVKGPGTRLDAIDLVVQGKITTSRKKTCRYQGGRTDTAEAWDQSFVVFDRRTGKELQRHEIPAAEPKCSATALLDTRTGKVSAGGDSTFVPQATIDAWLATLLKS